MSPPEQPPQVKYEGHKSFEQRLKGHKEQYPPDQHPGSKHHYDELRVKWKHIIEDTLERLYHELEHRSKPNHTSKHSIDQILQHHFLGPTENLWTSHQEVTKPQFDFRGHIVNQVKAYEREKSLRRSVKELDQRGYINTVTQLRMEVLPRRNNIHPDREDISKQHDTNAYDREIKAQGAKLEALCLVCSFDMPAHQTTNLKVVWHMASWETGALMEHIYKVRLGQNAEYEHVTFRSAVEDLAEKKMPGILDIPPRDLRDRF